MLKLKLRSLNKKKNIAHIALSIGPTSCVYNEHFLPVVHLGTKIIVFGEKDAVGHGEQIVYCKSSAVRFYRTLISIMKLGYIFNIHFVHLGALIFFLSPFFTKIIRVRRRTVVTMHTSWQNYKCINRIYYLISCIYFPKIIFCSKTSYGSNPNWVKVLIKNKYEIIENGLDINRLERAKFRGSMNLNQNIFNRNKNKKFIIACGRLVKSKCFDIVVNAFEELDVKDAILIVVGDGPEIEGLKYKARKSKARNSIIFFGLLERDRLYEIFNCCNFYMSASVVEGLPITLLEAMASNCFPILTDIPQHIDVVPRSNAEYFKKNNSKSAANALKRALAYPAIDLEKVINDNRHVAETKYSLDLMLYKYYRLYHKMD